jgi:DnaJ-class molecular chaperone
MAQDFSRPLWDFLCSLLWGNRVRRLVALSDSGCGLCLRMRLQSVQFFQWRRSANVRVIGRGEIPRTTGTTRQRQVMKSFIEPWRDGKMATCKTCKGEGSVECPVCKGKGYKPGGLVTSRTECSHCSGSGVKKCGACNGTGRT